MAIDTQSCCTKAFRTPCACKTACAPGECVNVPGKCPMHCGCAQHGHQR